MCEAHHRVSVGLPIRARPVDELLRHRADFEGMANRFDPLGQDLTQLAVGQVRSRIDVIEVEDKGERVGHPEKLLSIPPRINLCELVGPGEPTALPHGAGIGGYLIRIPGDSIFPA